MFTNHKKNQNNIYFMSLALKQAEIILGNTKKNPAVGCVIVKNQNVISSGHTSIQGAPHAEHNAINLSKFDLKNSELYVTLEPCSHYGKTPPCVNLIIKKKVKKVIFSIKDPDVRSFNKCKSKLKKRGIAVSDGVLKNKINSFYSSYIKYKKNDLPFVTCKLAVSKDFFTINKKNKWITNYLSRGRVHLMRASHDCIMTSSRTVDKDNPRLTCRIEGLTNRSPSRIILDNKLRIKINSRIIKNANLYHTIIFYNKTDKRKIALLKKLKIRIYKIPIDAEGNLDLKRSLLKARELGFSRIFLESGIKLISNFLKKSLVNEFKLFISNKKLKKNGSGYINKYFTSLLKNKKGQREKVNLLGDKLISYKLK